MASQSWRVWSACTWAATMAAAAAAQNVVPALLDGVEGGGGTNIPFGSSLGCRYQCVYDAVELPWSGPRVLTGIRLRADNNTPNVAMAAKTMTLSVLVSTTTKSAATASPVFADNHGLDATWVLQQQTVTLPAQPPLPAGPRPADVLLSFARPWTFGQTPMSAPDDPPGSLLVEIVIHSQGSGAYRVDNFNNCTALQADFGDRGPLCVVAGGGAVTLAGDATMQAGQPYTLQFTGLVPASPFLLLGGTAVGSALFGNPAWPLPYPLFDPADPALPSAAFAAFGGSAPDCWLNLDPTLLSAGVADAAGAGSMSVPVPAGRHIVGASLFAQGMALAPGANSLQVVTSLGRQATVCGPLAVARVYAFFDDAAVPPLPLPTSGTLQHGVGLVFAVQ